MVRHYSTTVVPAVTYAVGDIHGRADLLSELLDKLVSHRRDVPGSATLIFLGDYIDRGPDGRGVLTILRSPKLRCSFSRVVCLRGNHEQLLMERIDRADAIQDHLSLLYIEDEHGMKIPRLKAFLKSMRYFYSDGIRLFTHAGIGPDHELGQISEIDFLWYRGLVREKQGRLVVHGHTCMPGGPDVTVHAVNVDTCAYGTDQLTAAVFSGRSRRASFIFTPPDEVKLRQYLCTRRMHLSEAEH